MRELAILILTVLVAVVSTVATGGPGTEDDLTMPADRTALGDFAAAPSEGHVFHGLTGAGTDPGPRPDGTVPVDGVQTLVGESPSGIAITDEGIWVTDRELDRLYRLDPHGEMRLSLRVGAAPTGVTTSDDAVFVANTADGTVTELGRPDGGRRRTHRVGALPVALVASEDEVFVANSGEGTITRIDVGTGEASTSGRIGYGPIALTMGSDDRLWVVNSLDRAVVRIDPRTLDVVGEPIRVGGGPGGIVEAAGRMWVTSSGQGTVEAIDIVRAEVVSTIEVDATTGPGLGPAGIAANSGGIWVSNNNDRTIVRVDPVDETTSSPLFFNERAASAWMSAPIAATEEAVWVADQESGHVVSFDPSAPASSSGYPSKTKEGERT